MGEAFDRAFRNWIDDTIITGDQIMEITAVIEHPDFKQIEKEGMSLQQDADAFVVINDETRTVAADRLKLVSARVIQVESITEAPWRAALSAYEDIQRWRKGLMEKFLGPKRTWASKIGAYDFAIAEQRRKEAAATQAKAEADAKKKREAEIKAAQKAKDKESVKALQQAPLVVAPAAPKTPEPTKVSGVSTRFEWKLDVIFNPAALPRELLMPDVNAIKARIKSLGGNHGIPGVKAIQVPITSGRV